MKKIINNSRVSFYDDNWNEIMYIDYAIDECIWYFDNNDVITITKDMELFEMLQFIMSQHYIFSNDEFLKNYKDDNKLVWYSDCYYNPNDEWSIKAVSYLNIEYNDDSFKLWCVKPLDEIIERRNKFHCICFSPLGNGKYSKNNLTGLTLQDDFVTRVYQQLIKKDKNKILAKNLK